MILTETEVTTSEDDDGNLLSYKAIYAYRFLKKDNSWKEEWSVHHSEDECINYPVAEFVKESFSILRYPYYMILAIISTMALR